MAQLVFRVKSDWEEVVKLRNEIDRLKASLLSFNGISDPAGLKRLEQQLSQTTIEFNRLVQQAALAGHQLSRTNISINQTNSSANTLQGTLAKIGGAAMLTKLISDVVRVRGEFQLMDTSIQTLLGNKEKADKLLAQVKEYAKISPLGFKDVTSATQMMLGFNIEAEKVPQFIRSIGDVSMGEAGKFNSLTLAFSQMSATGKLMGQDLNQMINAGFNPLSVMAEKTGKSISTLKAEMSKGAISAEMVQQAFVDATSAGGKFYQMSENASKTINGQISMMQDAMDAAFNEMGQKSEGVIMNGIQKTTSLIENYEKIGKVLVGLIATYGTYRTAVMLNAASTNGWTIATTMQYKWLLLVEKAQKLLNATMLKNPYVLAAAVLVGAVSAMWALRDSTNAAERAQNSYNKTKEDAANKEQEHKNRIDDLLDSAINESLATLTRQTSLEELRKEYPKIFNKYDIENLKLTDILSLKKQINEEDSKRQVKGNVENYESLKKKVDEQKRYVRLYNNASLRENMSEEDADVWERYNMGHSGSRSAEVFFKIKNLLDANSKKLKLYQKDVLNDNLNAWKANLKSYTKERLEAELKAAQSKASKRSGFVIGSNMFKGEDLEGIVASLNTAISRKNPKTYKEDYEKAKSVWEVAKKKVTEIEKDKAKFTAEQYKKAKENEDAAEKKYKTLGGITGNGLTKQENQADKLRKEQEKYKALIDKQKIEQIRTEEDLQTQVDQARINAMVEGSEKYLAYQELNFEKEMQAIDKQKEDLLREKIDDKRAEHEADPSKNKLTFDASGVSLTDNEIKGFDIMYKSVLDKQDLLNQEMANKHQDYATQRLEIEKKYSNDIEVLHAQREVAEKAGSTALAEQLSRAIAQATKDKGAELISFDFDMLKKSPDYVRAFQNLRETSNETLKSLISQFQEFEQTAGKTMNPEDLREYTSTLQSMSDELDSRNPFKDLADRKKELAEAEQELALAKLQLDFVNSGGKIETGIKNTKMGADGKIITEKEYMSSTQALQEYNKAKDKQVKVSSKAEKAEKDVEEVIGDLANAMNEVGFAIGGLGGEIISLIGQIGTTTLFAIQGLTTTSNTASKAIQAVEKASVVLAIITAALQIAMKISELIKGQNKEQADTERLQKINDNIASTQAGINKLIEQRIELIRDATAAEAGYLNTLAKEDAELQKSYISEQFKRLLGSTMFAKRGKNNNLSLGDVMKKEGLISVEDFAQWWSDGGYIDYVVNQGFGVRDQSQWDSIVNNWQELEDIIKEAGEAMKEAATGTTFDALKDSLDDLLMSADTTFADISNSFEDHMRTAILNMVKSKYLTDALSEWYDQFAEAISDNSLSSGEAKQLKEVYQQIYQNAQNLYDNAADVAGILTESVSSSQSATFKESEAVSQDTVNELNGRFTALQMAGEEIKVQNYEHSMKLNEIKGGIDLSNYTLENLHNIADETRTILHESYMVQTEIRDNTAAIIKPIKEMSSRLENIEREVKSM